MSTLRAFEALACQLLPFPTLPCRVRRTATSGDRVLRSWRRFGTTCWLALFLGLLEERAPISIQTVESTFQLAVFGDDLAGAFAVGVELRSGQLFFEAGPAGLGRVGLSLHSYQG